MNRTLIAMVSVCLAASVFAVTSANGSSPVMNSTNVQGTDSTASRTTILEKEYQSLGRTEEKKGDIEEALWFYKRAALLSLDTLHLTGQGSPMNCGMLRNSGEMGSLSEEICAKSKYLCEKVIELKVHLMQQHMSAGSILYSDCSPKW